MQPSSGGKRTQLDKVADRAHDHETNANSPGDLDEFALVGFGAVSRVTRKRKGRAVRLVQRCRNCVPSLRKSRGMSRNSLTCSDMVTVRRVARKCWFSGLTVGDGVGEDRGRGCGCSGNVSGNDAGPCFFRQATGTGTGVEVSGWACQGRRASGAAG